MRFRESGLSSSRQRAARRLAEIEREIRHIKRLFPDLTIKPRRYRSQWARQGEPDSPAGADGRSGRYLIH
jgi:hypothetical protein